MPFLSVLQLAVPSPAWQSKIVCTDSNGKLVYQADSQGSRIPDFSYAGYRNSDVPIPLVAEVDSVSPIAGDNTANIQAAINRVAARSLDVNGFRGALLMKAGKYAVSGTLLVNASGMVLRGVGDDNEVDHNTFQNKFTTGDMLRIDSPDTISIAQRTWVHHNYFNNYPSTGANEASAVHIGMSGRMRLSAFSTVEHNPSIQTQGEIQGTIVNVSETVVVRPQLRRDEKVYAGAAMAC